MALWGSRDAFALTGTVSVANVGTTTTVTGSGTAFDTELEVGDSIIITGEKRKIVAISSNVSITIDPAWDAANVSGGTAEGQDSPKYVLASELSGNLIFGVDTTEAQVDANEANGLYTPGWVRYQTYTDMHGTTRNKVEPLVVFTSMTGDANTDDTVLADS